MAGSRPFASLTLLCLAQFAWSQTPSIPADVDGRPVRGARNEQLQYSTPTTQVGLGSQRHVESNAVSTTKHSHASAPQKSRGRIQKTGSSPSYDVVWRTSALGTGIGATGIWPMDTDADGTHEIILGGGFLFGGNSHWSILDYNEARKSYEIAWQSAPYYLYGTWSPSISALRAIEVDTTKRVWVGLSNGNVDVVDALTRETLQTLAFSGSAITDFAVGDADNDGHLDVAVLTSSAIYLVDPITLTPTATIAHGGHRFAIGNVDDDANLEVVLNTGFVLEITGTSTTVQWQAASPFGAQIDLADIDADGREELVAAEGWQLIRAFDVEAESYKWSVSTSHDIGALRLIDVTGDDVPEVIYGDGQWGAIHVIDAATTTELWYVSNPEHGTTDVAVFDSDGDGELEIMWGAGYSSTGPDYLFVHDLATRAREWQSNDYGGPYRAVDLGDVDADGELEIVVGSSESLSGYGSGLIMVFDARTKALEWSSSSNGLGGFSYTGVHALELVNVDADPQLEIVVGTDRSYDGALYVIDGLTHEVQNEAIYDSGSPLGVLDAADLTGDGYPEIIAGNFVEHTGSPGTFIYVLDPRTGDIVWRSAALAAGFAAITDIEVVDAGDPGADILAVHDSVHLVRWSDRRHRISTTMSYLAATAGDVHAATGNEILAGTQVGTIDILDGESLDVLASYEVCSSPINAIMMHAINQVVVACERSLVVYNLADEEIVDATTVAFDQLGAKGSLVRAVDGHRSLILTGGSEALLFADLSANNVPTLSAAAATASWRGSVDLQLVASDADGDPLHFEVVDLPTLGSVTWIDPVQGTLRYSGAGIGIGDDSVMVRVSDGSQYSATQKISITLTNAAPVANAAQHTIVRGSKFNGQFAASDADNDPLTFTIVDAPDQGSITIVESTGAFEYTPAANGTGTDTMKFEVSDGLARSQATVTFNYPPAAPPPSGGSGSGKGGGGGSFGSLLLLMLGLPALMLRISRRTARIRGVHGRSTYE